MNLFSEIEEQKQKELGNAVISYKNASSILTEAKGFMGAYDFTMNPYSGCSFGCTYCYAAFFSRSAEQMTNWGKWVTVKENALELLRRYTKRHDLNNKTIYISSVTDPYQPIERKLELTRSLLIELLKYQPKIVIQTRSPIAVRDIDLFNQFNNIQVNMTITTDSEDVRKIFEPLCPSNKSRLSAIKQINMAGVDTCITMTPLLPISEPEQFALHLKETGIKRFIIQPFHSDKGKFIAGTRDAAMAILKKMNWDDKRYSDVLEIIRKHIPEIGIGKEGFKPPK